MNICRLTTGNAVLTKSVPKKITGIVVSKYLPAVSLRGCRCDNFALKSRLLAIGTGYSVIQIDSCLTFVLIAATGQQFTQSFFPLSQHTGEFIRVIRAIRRRIPSYHTSLKKRHCNKLFVQFV
jgi:hypothetical protein